jgi:hypothetical protein
LIAFLEIACFGAQPFLIFAAILIGFNMIGPVPVADGSEVTVWLIRGLQLVVLPKIAVFSGISFGNRAGSFGCLDHG